jgi:hypothetical protein
MIPMYIAKRLKEKEWLTEAKLMKRNNRTVAIAAALMPRLH